jgi:hypothetical protein
MLLFGHRDIFYMFRCNIILIKYLFRLIISNTHQINGVPGYFHLHIIIARIFKLDMAAYIFIAAPFSYIGHAYRDLNLGKVTNVVFVFAGLFVKKPVRLIGKILMQCHVATSVKQVKQ